MIDFRYHLVSIVSIFLALAVGILLGAGPLREELGTTLTNQVSTLRKEKDVLRAQLDQAQQQVKASDEFASTVAPALVESRLGGRSVVLVTLPGVDKAVVTEVSKGLTASGAVISGTVAVDETWTDPAKRAFRDQLLTSLGPLVGLESVADSSLDTRMGRLLATALVVDRVSDAEHRSPNADRALSGLKDAGLISFDGDGPAPATLAVVVAPTPSDKAADDVQAAQLAGWTAIGATLDAASNGTVVVGDAASTGSGGLLHAVRTSDSVAKTVSTVDDADAAMGRIAIVYALRQQMAGEAGQYGSGTGATALLPPMIAGTS